MNNRIEVDFTNQFKGVLKTQTTKMRVGMGNGEVAPYDMLFGALASCMYSTFLDVSTKKRIHFNSAKVIVQGEKRKSVPSTLEWVKVSFVISGGSNEAGLEKAVEMAAKYCSIYHTIGTVARMSFECKCV